MTTPPFPVERFTVGDTVFARVPGATMSGVIIARNKQRSSPWKVRWNNPDFPAVSNENMMSITKTPVPRPER